MPGLQPWGYSPDEDQDIGSGKTGDAERPGPWLRAWVEFQVDARINQALRDLAEGELVASFGGTAATSSGALSEITECRGELQRVAEAHAGLLEVVEGLVGEVDKLTAFARTEFKPLERPLVANLEASLQDLHVQCRKEAEKSEATFQENRRMHREFVRLEEMLQGLQATHQDAPLRHMLERLERVEQRINQWQSETAVRIDDHVRSTSSATEASIRRLERELGSTADAWKEHEARINRLESDVTASAEAHIRHENCFDRLAGELAASAEAWRRLDWLERQHASSGEAHARHESRFERFSEELAGLSKGQILVERLERELALSAEAHGRHEGRLERISGDVKSLRELHGHMDRVKDELSQLKEELSSIAREHGESRSRHEGRLNDLHKRSLDSESSARLEQLQMALASLADTQDRQDSSLASLKDDVARLDRSTSQNRAAPFESFEKETATHFSEVEQQILKVDRELKASRNSTRLERLERELELSAEAHGRHDTRFERVDAKMVDRLERLEKDLAASLEDRFQELSLSLTSLQEGHSGHTDRLKRFGELAASTQQQASRLQALEQDHQDLQQAHDSHRQHIETLSNQLSLNRELRPDIDSRLKELREEFDELNLERRLRQNLQDMDRRLEESRRGLRADFESWQSGLEQDVTALQQKGAAELRVEVRTAIRNEAAAVAALDEQLWLTDQRLSRRIDDLEASSQKPLNSPPPRQRPQAVTKPITPARDAMHVYSRSTAALLAARAADSVSDTSDTDLYPRSGAARMASVAGEALTRNLDIRRRSGRGLASSGSGESGITVKPARDSLGSISAASTALNQDRDSLEVGDEVGSSVKARSSSARVRRTSSVTPRESNISSTRAPNSRSPSRLVARSAIEAFATQTDLDDSDIANAASWQVAGGGPKSRSRSREDGSTTASICTPSIGGGVLAAAKVLAEGGEL
mmetsp:Transcript_99823/g.177670  ORF Transcript_99823/g.177670 Transcript_99823/m.177670 type:complete len:941 (+) Transcript_99823:57-2879(+)|eukprot:CAMPEP_0197631358 /NCGR_PEP_ID=MMETSP1338-20131121/8540_1 /TAXON_ID=43686 ORGANISM="Pelagodinium beii, Strain RCC1491" /NCGR_SAMPLE_ID=MMETSP1338 /ASSEMBLY_ACC=CAM_ASM_000754 /LENGTH=940 /DNA_ID=CAMNT_0043202783 /DNA_START=57 /DNA_END=2879 /DNA_ORIENTATION=+